jgi:hypothetical protein
MREGPDFQAVLSARDFIAAEVFKHVRPFQMGND